MKTIMILVDGMRPDGMLGCGHPLVEKLLANSYYSLDAKTVFPSITLPCHMSLIHSVDPTRHGVTTNVYTPQVRPVNGLFDVLKDAGKRCSFFYGWEVLRDLARPESIWHAVFSSGLKYPWADTNVRLTAEAIKYICSDTPDFAFLYLGYADWMGHKKGWMTEDFLGSVSQSFDCIERVVNEIPEDYCVVVLADHGGHDRSHGSNLPEDMTIPVIFYNKNFEKTELTDVSILDVAPTIAALQGVAADLDWEGMVLDVKAID